jgi:hypothetical protein
MKKESIVTEYYNAMFDELHFIDQVIRNMHHLEHMYNHGPLVDDTEASDIEKELANWNCRREKVLKEITEMEHSYDTPPLYKAEV